MKLKERPNGKVGNSFNKLEIVNTGLGAARSRAIWLRGCVKLLLPCNWLEAAVGPTWADHLWKIPPREEHTRRQSSIYKTILLLLKIVTP